MQNWASELNSVYRMYNVSREELTVKTLKAFEKFPKDEELLKWKNKLDKEFEIYKTGDGVKKDEQEEDVKTVNNDKAGKSGVDVENSPTWTQILTPVTCDRLEKEAFSAIMDSEKKKENCL